MTIIGGVVYKKSMIFKVFGVYLSEFLIFLHEIFFGSKILLSSGDKIFGPFFGDFGRFLSCLLWHKPLRLGC